MAFITVTDVPIFDAHGDFAESDLIEIARNSQARIDDTGDACPLTLGHTPKRGENKPQPQIVGDARNFRVGQFGKTKPRACIFADFNIEAKHADTVREQYPRRSIELWPNDRVIDPIALLGATTPQRDLGLLKFNRHSDDSIHYSRERDGEPIRHEMRDGAMFGMEDFMSLFMETPVGKYLQNKMEEDMQAGAAASVNAEQVNKDAEELNAEAEGKDIDGDGDLDTLGTDEGDNLHDDDAPPDVDAEAGDDESPFPPDESNDPKKKKEPVKMAKQEKSEATEKIRMERDSLAIKFAKLEERLKVTESKLEAAEKKAAKAERERAFAQLESEGLDFERAEEMAYCEDMSAEQFAKHCDHMKKRYQRATPGRGRPLETRQIGDGGGEPRKKVIASGDELEQVHKFARDKGIKFDEALKQLATK